LELDIAGQILLHTVSFASANDNRLTIETVNIPQVLILEETKSKANWPQEQLLEEAPIREEPCWLLKQIRGISNFQLPDSADVAVLPKETP
jgi:hypothetical protein